MHYFKTSSVDIIIKFLIENFKYLQIQGIQVDGCCRDNRNELDIVPCFNLNDSISKINNVVGDKKYINHFNLSFEIENNNNTYDIIIENKSSCNKFPTNKMMYFKNNLNFHNTEIVTDLFFFDNDLILKESLLLFLKHVKKELSNSLEISELLRQNKIINF